MAIPKIYKYGIEITKPWSKEMYSFNENLKEMMLDQISLRVQSIKTIEDANKIASIINPYKYGSGYDLEDMISDMLMNVETFENYWLAEIWNELIEEDYVVPIIENGESRLIIGFESREDILKLREKHNSKK